MKKQKTIYTITGILFLILAFYLIFPLIFPPKNLFSTDNVSLPNNYTLDKYMITERTGPTCQTNSDCTLPSNYAIRSNCPYVSVCMQNSCTVVCPEVK